MKKIVNLSIVIVLVLGLLLANGPTNIAAAASKPLIAEGAWSTGTEVTVDLTITSAPSWMQLLTKGVKITAPAKICHPFNGGRFGWVGEIRQLVKGNWVKLATTNDWVPDTEGLFMSCAQAPAAGTYALFGYWIRPAGYVEEPDNDNPFNCSTVDWGAILLNAVENPIDLPDVYLYPWFYNAPIGTPVTYTVTGMDPDHAYGGTLTGNGLIGSNGYVLFGMNQLTIPPEDPWESLTVDFSFLGCTFTQVFINNVN